MDDQIQDLQDKYADNFKNQVFVPADFTGKQAVIDDILNLSARVIYLREMRAQSQLTGAGQSANKQNLLMQKESEIGGQIFGQVAQGEQRSFFCLDKNTWIWYEAWVDQTTHKPVNQTTRYEITSAGVAKSSQISSYQMLEGRELENFYNAVKVYCLMVEQKIYS